MKRGQHPAGGDFEHGAGVLVSAINGCSVEIAVIGLHQAAVGASPISTARVRLRAKAVKDGHGAVRLHFEHGAFVVRSTPVGYPIEISVVGLNQAAARVSAVRTGESVQSGQGTVGCDLERRATATIRTAGINYPTYSRRSVEVAVCAPHQRGGRQGAIGAPRLRAKVIERIEGLRGRGNRRRETKQEEKANCLGQDEAAHALLVPAYRKASGLEFTASAVAGHRESTRQHELTVAGSVCDL